MDVTSLRAEIKSWERQFKKQNGREPSVQDIKGAPGMPEKYKLYKKLSKTHAAPSASASSSKAPLPIPADRLSTPPRQSAPSVLSKHKSRAVRTETSESTLNPFSPTKNKGKERALVAIDSLSISATSHANDNPFATPRRARTQSHKPARASRKDPSPDPFPLIPAHLPSTPRSHPSTAPQSTLDPTIDQSHAYRDVPGISASSPPEYAETPVTRARKRLRGERVAPSPVKEKRARLFSQQSSSLASARHSTIFESSGDEGTGEAERFEDAVEDEEEMFFGESPMKQSTNGKHFKLLFDESDVTLVQPHVKPKAPSRTKSAIFATIPFAHEPSQHHVKTKSSSRAVSPESSDDDMDVDFDTPAGKKIEALDISLKGKPEKKSRSARTGLPRAMLPGKDDLWAPAPAPSVNGAQLGKAGASTASRLVVTGAKAGASQSIVASRPAKRRSLSGDEMDVDEPPTMFGQETEGLVRPTSQPQLLPPSPPDTRSSSSRTGDKGKGKGFPGTGSRKKAKLLEQLFADQAGEDDAEDEEGDTQVKEREWSWNARRKALQDADVDVDDDSGAEADSEPEFDPTLYRPVTAGAPTIQEESTVEVDVPEELHEVLAFDVERPTKTYDLDEELVARELLYGRRESHYDAQRGGEIWGAGEMSMGEEEVVDKGGDDTDEWEGEPVPWEVGEL